MRGIHQWLVDSPHNGHVVQKAFPYHKVIMDKNLDMQIRHICNSWSTGSWHHQVIVIHDTSHVCLRIPAPCLSLSAIFPGHVCLGIPVSCLSSSAMFPGQTGFWQLWIIQTNPRVSGQGSKVLDLMPLCLSSESLRNCAAGHEGCKIYDLLMFYFKRIIIIKLKKLHFMTIFIFVEMSVTISWYSLWLLWYYSVFSLFQ